MPEPINLEWLLSNFSVWGYGHPDENEPSEDPLGSDDCEKENDPSEDPLGSDDWEKETCPETQEKWRWEPGNWECGS